MAGEVWLSPDGVTLVDHQGRVIPTGASGSVLSVDGQTGVVTLSGTYQSLATFVEDAQDVIGAMVTGNTETNIAVTYNDATGKLDFVATGGGGPGTTEVYVEDPEAPGTYVAAVFYVGGTDPAIGGDDPYVWLDPGDLGGGDFQPLDPDLTALAAAGNSAVLAATTASFLVADETKLDGIEAAADVTDAANVTAAGAVMESDFDAHTMLYATVDNTPVPLTVAASSVVGRKSSGNIVALTAAETGALVGAEVYKQAQELNAQTGTTYTVVTADLGKLVTLTNASAITLTLPQDSGATLPVGTQVHFVQLGAGQVTAVAGSGATLNATPGAKFRAQFSATTAIKTAANTWLLVGDLST